MNDRISGLLIGIILVSTIIFTQLTIETVEVDGNKVPYCRKIEFWCYKSYDAQIIKNSDGKYELAYPQEYKNFEVKNGMLISSDDPDYKTKTTIADGKYDVVTTFYNTEADGNDVLYPVTEVDIVGSDNSVY